MIPIGEYTKQHFVPQSYLTPFICRDEKCCVYDKITKKMFYSSTYDICSKRNMYDLSFDGLEIKPPVEVDPKLNEKLLGIIDGFYPNILEFISSNDIGIDLDDLMQEGSIGLLNAIPLFDAGRGMKFLTYAAPALRNAMTDCIRAALGLFEQRMVDKKDAPGFQRVYLDDVLSEDERMLRIEAIADPHTQTPEQIYIQKEQLIELYAALDKLTAREQTYLLYRYGFTDGIEHPLIGAALHFHLSESRTKKVEGEAMDSLRGKLPWWF